MTEDRYLAIDGLSIEEQLKRNLNASGVFTDQNFEGSNLSLLNKQFAYAFSLLLYTLNQNIYGGMFSETEIYENMSRILKFISYKPIGYQTAFVPVEIYATTSIDSGSYTIPRYSFVQIGGIKYSILEDITFVKNSSGEILVSDDIIFYQGDVQEYKIPFIQGIPNEKFLLNTNNSALIDHNNIHVYVKRDGTWSKWDYTTSLFLNNGTAQVYDIRFNENKKYELTFGNNINGSQLLPSDEVVVYYVKSNGKTGEIAANTFQRRNLTVYKSPNFNAIFTDTSTSLNTATNGVVVSNICPSTNFQTNETVEEMRTNAPNFFNSQFRLITENDYDIFIHSNFGNLIQDVKIMNNTDYVNSYMKYFYDMGLTDAELDSRALFNQLNFADSCNFNNIYGFIIPKYNQGLGIASSAQKSLIVNTIRTAKTITSDFIVSDPVYIYFDFAVNVAKTNTAVPEDADYTVLKIIRNRNTRKNTVEIANAVSDIFVKYFDPLTRKFDETIDILGMTNEILNIEGVDSIQTENILTGNSTSGISLLSWNPSFVERSGLVVTSNYKLLPFQVAYFVNLNNILNKIVVV